MGTIEDGKENDVATCDVRLDAPRIWYHMLLRTTVLAEIGVCRPVEMDAQGSVLSPPKVIQEALSRDSSTAAGTLMVAK